MLWFSGENGFLRTTSTTNVLKRRMLLNCRLEVTESMLLQAELLLSKLAAEVAFFGQICMCEICHLLLIAIGFLRSLLLYYRCKRSFTSERIKNLVKAQFCLQM